MKPYISTITILSFILVMCWACETGVSPEVTSVDLETTIAALADDEWELYDEVLRFTPESLYEQINGRAELYLSYNVIRLTHASFDNRHDDRLSISVSVYDMGSPINAFGIFSVERFPGEPKVDLGRDAYRTNADYYIWHGQHYIRIISSDTGEESRRFGLDWARILVGALPASGGGVWGFDLLPRHNLVEDSVRYFVVDAMGLDFMHDTFTAQYSSDGGPVTAFISRSGLAEGTTHVMDQYREFADHYGDTTEIQTINGADFLVCDMGDSFDVVSTKGRLICGVTAVKDRAHAIQQAAAIWRSMPN